ncbi:MAG: hypothetical protein QW334_02355 [Thermofilum sp.]
MDAVVVVIVMVVVFSAYLANRFLQLAEPFWSLMLLPVLCGVAALSFAVALLVKERRKALNPA